MNYFKKNRKRKTVLQSTRAKQVVCVPSVSSIFISVKGEWLSEKVGDKIDNISDRYIADATEQFRVIKLLGREVKAENVGMRRSVQIGYCYTIMYQERKCRIYKKRCSKDKDY